MVTGEFVRVRWCFGCLVCVWLGDMAIEWERHGRKDGGNICVLCFIVFFLVYVELNKC